MSPSRLPPVQQASAQEQVLTSLLKELESGRWQPGDRFLSEKDLCEALGVSRITAREGVKKLVGMGLLETRRGIGTFVRGVSAEQIMKRLLPLINLTPEQALRLFEYRRVVEAGALRLAALRATADDLADLSGIVDEMERYADDPLRYAVIDADFSIRVAEASRNSFVEDAVLSIRGVLEKFVLYVLTPQGARDGVALRRTIIAHLRAQQPDEAARTLQKIFDAVAVCIEMKSPHP